MGREGGREMIELFNGWVLDADLHQFILQKRMGTRIREGKEEQTYYPTKYYIADFNALMKRIFYIAVREGMKDLTSLDELKQLIQDSMIMIDGYAHNLEPDYRQVK